MLDLNCRPPALQIHLYCDTYACASIAAGRFPHIYVRMSYVGKTTSHYAGHIHMHKCHNRGESQ